MLSVIRTTVYILCTAAVTFGVTIPKLDYYYQDLTAQIDGALRDDEDLNSTELLKNALNESTRVYYSSDISMNEIMTIMPVIQLLEQLKPENSQISILLSLRYTYQNRFSRPSFDDIFYDLSLNITSESIKHLQSYLAGIVLDWSADDCREADYFYSKPGHFNNFEPSAHYSFPRYIKNFINYYCTDSDAPCSIPVGLAFNSTQAGSHCTKYLGSQVIDADFYVITIQYSAYNGFPFSLATFLENFTGNVENSSILVGDALRQKRFYMNLNMEYGQVDAFNITSRWNNTVASLLSSSSHYSQVLHEMVETSFWTNFAYILEHSVFTKKIFTNFGVGAGISNLANANLNYDFIIGKSLTPLLAQLKQRFETFDQNVVENQYGIQESMLIPRVGSFIREVDQTPCSLAYQFSNTGKGHLVVNKDAWRALARHQQKILGHTNLNCGMYYYVDTSDNDVKSNIIAENKIILIFEHGMQQTWSALEGNMNRLVKKHQSIGNASLDTLVFYEDDLTAQPSKNMSATTGYEGKAQQIAKFLRKWDNTMSTGCIVNFTDARLAKIVNETKGINFRKQAAKFCEPIFDILDLMIWEIPDDDHHPVQYGYTGMYDDVMAARQVFLREFPNMKIIVTFKSGLVHSFIADDWAKYYGIPVVQNDEGMSYGYAVGA